MGFILFCSQLRKEFEKCQKLFYKIIFYIVPFCSVFQIFSVSDQNGIIFLTTQIIFIVFFSFLEPLMQLRSNEKEAKRGITTILYSSQNSDF